MPGVTGEYGPYRFVYDEKAAQDAERRADTFMGEHMPSNSSRREPLG